MRVCGILAHGTLAPCNERKHFLPQMRDPRYKNCQNPPWAKKTTLKTPTDTQSKSPNTRYKKCQSASIYPGQFKRIICIRDIDYNMPTECYENFRYVLLAISCIRFWCRSDTAPAKPGYRRISICGQTSGTHKRDLQGSPSTRKHWHQIFTCSCLYLTERAWRQDYKTSPKSDQILWTEIYFFVFGQKKVDLKHRLNIDQLFKFFRIAKTWREGTLIRPFWEVRHEARTGLNSNSTSK